MWSAFDKQQTNSETQSVDKCYPNFANGLASMVANVRIGISRKILFKVIIRNYAASCTMHGSCEFFCVYRIALFNGFIFEFFL